MQTKTLIKDTAQVARVHQLAEGDAYRRLMPKDSYRDAQMALGVVTGILNNGESIALTALEVAPGRFGGDAEVKEKVFEASDDLALFPVNDEETEVILSQARATAERSVTTAEKSLRDARDKHDQLEALADRITEAQVQIDNSDSNVTSIDS